MSFIGLKRGIIQPRVGLPQKSHDFESSSSQSIQNTRANIGNLNITDFALHTYFKRETTTGEMVLFGIHGNSSSRTCELILNSSNQLEWSVWSGSTLLGQRKTTPTYTDTSWYGVYAVWDSNNGTAGDRIRLYVNGVQPSFSSSTNPSSGALPQASENNYYWGQRRQTGNKKFFDGKQYQQSIFRNTVPAIGSVYDSGPVDISELSGLATLVDPDTSAVADKIISDWTNNGGTVTSTDIPS